MKTMKTILTIALLMAVGISPAFAAGACTKEDVKKAVDYAVDLINSKGGEAAYPELEKFRFCGEEGYIWVSDVDGLMLMHPISKKLVNVNQAGLQDPNGKFFYAEFLAKVKKDGQGWTSYQWMNPATKKLDTKCSYCKMTKVTIKGKKVWCGAGVYGISEAECK